MVIKKTQSGSQLGVEGAYSAYFREQRRNSDLERQLGDVKQYLLDHITKEPGPLGDDCWIWALSLSEGYGQVSWNGFGGRAHRWSYQVFVGPIPAGRQVQHKCDRKDCLNPDHLKLGDHVSNKADQFSRGDPEVTPQEFERLCNELADLDRKASLTDVRRKQIEAQLRRTISNHRAAEHRTIIKQHRLDLRLQRKAERDEKEQASKERRAEVLGRLSPEARAKLQARIAQLKEYTKEELRQEAIEEQKKAKQDRAALRRF